MKNLLKILLVCFVASVTAGDNDIYLTQSGGGAFILTIDQIGNTNKVCTSGTRSTFAGASITADIKQQGNTNTLANAIAPIMANATDRIATSITLNKPVQSFSLSNIS